MTVKQEVLQMLMEAAGRDVSGQEMAERLHVTRNAVWKAVSALRAEGYAVSAGNNRGYALSTESDVLSEAGIRAALPEAYRTLDVTVYETLDSTNNEAKRRIGAGLDHSLLIVAGSQTAGRGRMGRSFYSPADTGAYMTLAFPVRSEIEDAIRFTSAAAVAVVRAVKHLTDKRPKIKWVNDVYLDGRKICGILAEGMTNLETGTVEHMLIGIGVNLTTADFPPDVAMVATALGAATLTRCALIGAVAGELLAFIEHPADRAFLDDYRRCSLVTGKRITYTRGEQTGAGVAIGIGDDCALLVRRDDGTEVALRSGEITVRLK